MNASVVDSTYLHSLRQKAFQHGFMPLHLRNANIMFLLFVCLFACLFACLFVLLLARLQLSPALRE